MRRCFTLTPSRSNVVGQVSSVDVIDINECCLHDLKEMGLYPLTVDADVLEMAKYVNNNKIILVYVEHGSSNVHSSIFVTPKKGVAIAVDNYLRKAPIEIDSSPNVNRNLTPMCHRNLTKEWEHVSSKALSIGNSSTVDDVLDLQMLFKTEGAGPIGKFKEVEVDADNKSEEESDTEENDTIEDVPMSMNNFNFTLDPKHDLSVGAVEVQERDLDVIDYDSFGSDLDDGIDLERRIQLRELRRIGKQKNKGANKYYFYLGQQFAIKEIVTGRVRKHSIETRRKLIMVKNDKEMTKGNESLLEERKRLHDQILQVEGASTRATGELAEARVERGMCMGRTDAQFQVALHRVSNFIPGAKTGHTRLLLLFLLWIFYYLGKYRSAKNLLEEVVVLELD
ncbi:hypothetical protein Tco_0935825 [Tanacetum coccineum]